MSKIFKKCDLNGSDYDYVLHCETNIYYSTENIKYSVTQTDSGSF